MNNTISRKWNPTALVSIEDLSGMTFQGETGGHTFEVSGSSSLSGTATAVFLRADNAAIQLTGSISNGKAVVTLTGNCYTVPGRFLLTVFLTSGGQKVAIYSAMGNVTRTDGVAAGSVPPLVTDSIQTGDIDASGDVTVGGVFEVKKRRSVNTLSQEGWYRVLTYSGQNWSDAVGNVARIFDFNITRTYSGNNNEAHKISILNPYNDFTFVNEASKANSLLIDKIRVVLNDSIYKLYIDVHYNGSTSNRVSVDFILHGESGIQGNCVASGLESVAASPSGEAVLAEYNFTSNTDGNVKSLISIARTSGGTMTVSKAFRSGRILQLYLNCTTGAAAAEGDDIFIGTISAPYRPVAMIHNSAQYSSNIVITRIDDDGNIGVRVCKGSFSSGSTIGISLIYMI